MFKQITGTLGALFASFCCLGLPPLLAALSAAGLGFLLQDAVLVPLLALFLALTLWGLWSSRRRHGRAEPFYLGTGGALAAVAGILTFMPVHILGLVAVIAATAWDFVLVKRHRVACASSSEEGVPE